MELTLVPGTANHGLAQAIAVHVGRALARVDVGRFADSECHIEIQENVRGHDVYIVQPTSPPGDEHLMELLLLADACRRAGAARITAVIPYLGYARQDRRSAGREAVGARLVADLLPVAGIDRAVIVDAHTPAIEGFFGIPVEHVSAVPELCEAAAERISPNTVVVAPDLGAAKLAQLVSARLGLPAAMVEKRRTSGSEVEVGEILGVVAGRELLIVDDMISTGATVVAAVEAAVRAGASPRVTVMATHGLFVGPAKHRLADLPVERVLVTDSIAQATTTAFPLETVSISILLAEVIERLHRDEALRASHGASARTT